MNAHVRIIAAPVHAGTILRWGTGPASYTITILTKSKYASATPTFPINAIVVTATAAKDTCPFNGGAFFLLRSGGNAANAAIDKLTL
jgi:hypothetical protein